MEVITRGDERIGPHHFDPALLDRFPTAEARPDAEVEDLKRIWAAPTGWAP